MADVIGPIMSEEAAPGGGISPSVSQATTKYGVRPGLRPEAPKVSGINPLRQAAAGPVSAPPHVLMAAAGHGISPANPPGPESFSHQNRDFKGFPP